MFQWVEHVKLLFLLGCTLWMGCYMATALRKHDDCTASSVDRLWRLVHHVNAFVCDEAGSTELSFSSPLGDGEPTPFLFHSASPYIITFAQVYRP